MGTRRETWSSTRSVRSIGIAWNLCSKIVLQLERVDEADTFIPKRSSPPVLASRAPLSSPGHNVSSTPSFSSHPPAPIEVVVNHQSETSPCHSSCQPSRTIMDRVHSQEREASSKDAMRGHGFSSNSLHIIPSFPLAHSRIRLRMYPMKWTSQV